MCRNGKSLRAKNTPGEFMNCFGLSGDCSLISVDLRGPSRKTSDVSRYFGACLLWSEMATHG
jgi:hypothetical protein